MKRLFLPVLLLLPVIAFGQDAHIVNQKNRRFVPGEITIRRGEAITVTNDDDFIHQIYVAGPGFSFDSDEREPGQNITQAFTASGTFEVRCHIHPKMKLVVHVK